MKIVIDWFDLVIIVVGVCSVLFLLLCRFYYAAKAKHKSFRSKMNDAKEEEK